MKSLISALIGGDISLNRWLTGVMDAADDLWDLLDVEELATLSPPAGIDLRPKP